MKYKRKEDGFIEKCDAIAAVQYTKDENGNTDVLVLEDWKSINEMNDEIRDFYAITPLVKYEPWRKALVAWCDIRHPFRAKKEMLGRDSDYHKITFLYDEKEPWAQEISFVFHFMHEENVEKLETWDAIEDNKIYDMEELVGKEYDEEYERVHGHD